jgi:RHS repeat-associated protein
MKRAVLKALGLAAVVAAWTGWASEAWCQVSPAPPPPTYMSTDANGVELSTGQMPVSLPTLSLGSDRAGMTFQWTMNEANGASGMLNLNTNNGFYGGIFRSNLDGKVYETGSLYYPNGQYSQGYPYFSISVSGKSYWFDASTFQNLLDDGATLTTASSSQLDSGAHGGLVLTEADGTVAIFEALPYGSIPGDSEYMDLHTLTKPDGELLTFTYTQFSASLGPPGPSYFEKTISVTSSLGYQLHYEYDPSNPLMPTKIEVINLSTDYCDPAASNCSLSINWPALNFSFASAPISGFPQQESMSVTDALGRTTTIDPDPAVGLKQLTPPTSGNYGISRLMTQSGIGTSSWIDTYNVNKGTGNWTYSLPNLTGTWCQGCDPGYGAVSNQDTIMDPLGHQRVVGIYFTYWGDPRAGRITSDTDALNHTTYIAYDTYGRITSITHPEGNTEQYAYDARGNVLSETKTPVTGSGLANIVTSATYPSTCSNPFTCNKPTAVFDAKGNETDYTYDSTHGGVLTETGPAASNGVRPQTRYSYTQIPTFAKNSSGTLVQVGSIWELTGTSQCRTGSAPSCVGTADEIKTTYVYAALSLYGGSTCNPSAGDGSCNALPYQVTTAAGDGSISATTTYNYDVYGNVQSVTNPLSHTLVTLYDADREKVGTIDPMNRATRITYTPDGLVSLSEQGTVTSQTTSWSTFNSQFSSQQQVATTYDAEDRKIQESTTSGGTTYGLTQYSYDADNRLVCTAVRMNPATFGSPPGACTLGTSGSDGPDRISQNNYDTINEVTSIIQGLGTSNQRTYDAMTYGANGEKLTDQDANLNLTTYNYDGFLRLAKTIYPSPTSVGSSNPSDYEAFTYDAQSNMVTDRLRDGTTLTLTHDALNRKTTDRNGAALSYDNLNHLTSAVLGGSTVSMGYDALGRKTSETSSLGTISYLYDLAGGRARVTWPDGLYINYVRDADEEVTNIQENGATSGLGLLATYSYDSLGRRTAITRGNGGITGYGYDGLSRLTSLSQNLAPQGQVWGFTYNAQSQIDAKTSVTPAFDWNGAYAVNRGYSNNGLNQMTASGPYSLTYDARGNLTSDGVNTYTYNAVNQLTARSGGVSLTYDPLGRLASTTGSATTQFAYSGDQLLGEYDGSGNLLRRYVPGALAADDPILWYEGTGTSNRRWLIDDYQSSVVGATDATGALIGTSPNTYDEYGVPGAANQGRYQYTGQIWIPELGLYHYKARTYSPTLGRFLEVDPIGYTDDLDLYAYVADDPLNKTDPTGNQVAAAAAAGCAADAETGCVPGAIVGAAIAGCAMSSGCRDAVAGAWNGIFHNDEKPADQPPPGTKESDKGCIYCVKGDKTSSGKPYVGSADDLGKRAGDKSDGRDRKGAEVIGDYPKGDKEARGNAEQKGMNDRGGVKDLDNKRNEVAPKNWPDRGIKPPNEE